MRRIQKLPDWVTNFFDFGARTPINRIAYTEDDVKYKVMVIQKMQELGMKVSYDKIGNICGTLNNNSPNTLAMCSHTDSVPNGGQYDGNAGVIASLIATEHLLAQGKKPNVNLKTIICACEESSRFNLACIGSKFLNGSIGEMSAIVDASGINLAEAVNSSHSLMKKHMEKCGVSGVASVDRVMEKDECNTALELHIEQFDTLARKGKQIGVVNSIASSHRMGINIRGQEGHSGSTPMRERKDAVVAGSLFVTEATKLASRSGSTYRITIPKFETGSSSINKIQQDVALTVDVRIQSPNLAVEIAQILQEVIQKIEAKTGTKFNTSLLNSGNPVKTSDDLSAKLYNSSHALGLKTAIMPSWATHDIAFLPAKKRGLLFIPSTGGSHNSNEQTTEQDIKNGASVIAKTIDEK